MNNETNQSLTPKVHDILGVKVSCISWSISCNEHLEYYDDPEGYYDTDELKGLDLTKDIYLLRYYPNTPVGFCRISANTITELLSKLKEI